MGGLLKDFKWTSVYYMYKINIDRTNVLSHILTLSVRQLATVAVTTLLYVDLLIQPLCNLMNEI